MFERFTERARQAVVFGQDEARRFKHNYIGTEHLLLGLIREEEGIAARVLASFDVTLEEVRERVAQIVGRGGEIAAGQIPFTPRAKRVLELSIREALSLGHGYVGTEHVLLGLLREGEGVANHILLDLGANAETVRARLLSMLAGGDETEVATGWGPAHWLEYVPRDHERTSSLRSYVLVGAVLFGAGLAVGRLLRR
jgi:ATP-dependent Clp protease ATP-binding subunit ClpC